MTPEEREAAYAVARGGSDPQANLELLQALNAMDAKNAENVKLRKVCIESNAVCCCGCPPEEHENYGEEGEACGLDHDCIRTSRGVAVLLHNARAQVAIDGLARERAEAALTDERRKVREFRRDMRLLCGIALSGELVDILLKDMDRRDLTGEEPK